jgi:hypothetical protein
MPDEPKNPNAWWAVKIPAREMHPVRWSQMKKKRLIWLIPLILLMATIEIYYCLKLMQMR